MEPKTLRAIKEAFLNGQLVFFFDIDGTLSELIPNPSEAFIDKDIADWIYKIEDLFPGTVVFVTGRPFSEASELLKLSDGSLLFDKLGYFNGIFNHGQSLYVNQSINEKRATVEFKLSEEQLAYLQMAKSTAEQKTRVFAKENNFEIIVDDKNGIKVKNGNGVGYLLEIKSDEHGLSSMVFHWRVINKHACCKAWEKLIDGFAKEHAGQHKFQMSANSDMVREFALPFDKGTMVKKCLEETQEFASKKYVIAAGDAADHDKGTDWPMLKYVLDLNRENNQVGIAFHVRHEGKDPSSLPGIRIVNGVNEMKELLLGLNLETLLGDTLCVPKLG